MKDLYLKTKFKMTVLNLIGKIIGLTADIFLYLLVLELLFLSFTGLKKSSFVYFPKQQSPYQSHEELAIKDCGL